LACLPRRGPYSFLAQPPPHCSTTYLFTDQVFFSEETARGWVKINATGALSTIFLAGLWWTWRHRNQICLSHETWSLTQIHFHIQSSVEMIKSTFHTATAPHPDRMVRWNSGNFSCFVLNVDGSCLGTPTRAGYGGIIRNSAGLYLSGFSGYIAATTGILFAELTAIHRGLLLAVESGIEVLVCYSDSLLSTKLIMDHVSNYHAYVVLIQDIKDILSSRNFSIHHCLREGNQCADFLAKLGTTSKRPSPFDQERRHENFLP
jgi:ribonuclease HI